ncbi:MAG: HEPN domain-containing protein [Nanoarchaeota archaeon]
MVSIKWCCNQRSGIKIDSPNDNLVQSFINMAENAIGTMNREKTLNPQFSISACYYSMYYSLYAVLIKIGVKSEIHQCTLEFMKQFLMDFYSQEEIKIIRKAFDVRDTTQYYANSVVNQDDVNFIMSRAPLFLNKSKAVLSKLNENDMKRIRTELSKICKQ